MNVLILDSEKTAISQHEKSMAQWGHHIFLAQNEQQTIEYIKISEIDIVLTGYLSPQADHLELSQQIRAMDLKRYVYVILVIPKDKTREITQSLPSGVDDYVIWPLNIDELRARIQIGARIIKLESELNQKYLAIKRSYYQSIQMFTQLIETYNKDLGDHSRRVGQLALELAARHPGVKPEDYPIVEAAGLLHDIGLIGLPGALVSKSLTEMNGDEKKGYYTHPERGELILSQVDLFRPVAKIVRMHHEQPNGRGFPDGLAEKLIPLTAAVVGAASIYDQLVQQKKMPLAQIPEQLQQCRGYQISADLIDLLLTINLDRMEAEAKQTYHEIDIEELQAGMVLANDIHMRTGAFIMGAETRIDATVIEKLKRYHELGNISSNVFIKK